MITRKRLPIQQNLMLSVCRLVETGQQKVQIRSQRPHGGDFFRLSSNNLRHRTGSLLSQQLPLSKGRVLEVREMATHPDGRPGIQLGL